MEGKRGRQREGGIGRTESDNFIGRSADRPPLTLAAGTIFAADDFSQRIAPADTVQEAEGIPDVAFAAGVRSHDYGKRADAQGLVGEVLEIPQADRRNHRTSSGGLAKLLLARSAIRGIIRRPDPMSAVRALQLSGSGSRLLPVRQVCTASRFLSVGSALIPSPIFFSAIRNS